MKRGKHTSNMDIVRAYQAGDRPFVQVGYKETEDMTKRKVGEVWTDTRGKSWVQKEYGKASHTPLMDMISTEINVKCNTCKKDIKWGSKQDSKMFVKTGMCLDCLTDYETQIRIKGKWSVYEQKKLYENERSYIMDIKAKVKDGLDYTKKTHVLTFVNSNGLVEEWEDNRRDELLKSLKKDHVKCLKEIGRLDKEIAKLDADLKSVA